MVSKKERRRLAIEKEAAKRAQERLGRCPLSRSEYEVIHDAVTRRIVRDGHDGSFRITEEVATERGVNFDDFSPFLKSLRMGDDWEFLIIMETQ